MKPEHDTEHPAPSAADAETEAPAAAEPAKAPQPAPAPPPAPSEPALVSAGAGFNPKGRRMLVELLLIAAVVVAIGVATLKGGGAFAAALTPMVPLSVDRKLGELASVSLGLRECKNPELKKYVEELARPLLVAAEPLPFPFSFRVVDDSAVNAFALPGGFVVVNRGLLEAANTGEEVAGVLGHEVQHALLRHGTRRVLREMGGSFALSLLLGGSDLQGYAQVASKLTGLKYDRAQESEADREGVALLLRAGIDPSGLARFFERLTEGGLNPPEFASTHPDPGNRAAEIRAARLPGPARALPKPGPARCEGP